VRRARTEYLPSYRWPLSAQTDVIDGHETVKFGLILYIGSAVSILKRGKLTPHKGGVVDKFSVRQVPFTIDRSGVLLLTWNDHCIQWMPCDTW